MYKIVAANKTVYEQIQRIQPPEYFNCIKRVLTALQKTPQPPQTKFLSPLKGKTKGSYIISACGYFIFYDIHKDKKIIVITSLRKAWEETIPDLWISGQL